VQRVLEALEQGEPVILPVDTLFGVAARCDLPEAPSLLASLKGRDPAKPLSIVFRDMSQFEEWLQPEADMAATLNRLLPGPYTLIVPASPRISALNPLWSSGVGVRLPGQCPASELLSRLPWPLALSSANLSGDADPVDQADIDPQILSGVSAVLPGRPPLKQASTVIDLRGDAPRVLREGAVRGSALNDVLETL